MDEEWTGFVSAESTESAPKDNNKADEGDKQEVKEKEGGEKDEVKQSNSGWVSELLSVGGDWTSLLKKNVPESGKKSQIAQAFSSDDPFLALLTQDLELQGLKPPPPQPQSQSQPPLSPKFAPQEEEPKVDASANSHLFQLGFLLAQKEKQKVDSSYKAQQREELRPCEYTCPGFAFVDQKGLLASDLLAAFRSQSFSDVTLVLKNPEGEELSRIAAHRLILAARSEYFRALLTGNWKETNTDELVMTLDEENGVRAETFNTMIDYLYSAELEWKKREDMLLSSRDAWELVLASRFYGIPSLESLSLRHIADCINQETVCEIWNTAHAWDCETLAVECLKYACANFQGDVPPPPVGGFSPFGYMNPYSGISAYPPYGTPPLPPSTLYQPSTYALYSSKGKKAIWKSDGWDTLDKQLLITLLYQDTLVCFDELQVWEAMLKWAKANPLLDEEEKEEKEEKEKEKEEEREKEEGNKKRKENKEAVIDQLRDLVHYLREGTMKPEEWAQVTASGYYPCPKPLTVSFKKNGMRVAQQQIRGAPFMPPMIPLSCMPGPINPPSLPPWPPGGGGL